MVQNTSRTLGFQNIMVYKAPLKGCGNHMLVAYLACRCWFQEEEQQWIQNNVRGSLGERQQKRIGIRTYIHAHTQALLRTHTNTHIRTCTYASIQLQKHTNMQMRIHTRTYIQEHTQAHHYACTKIRIYILTTILQWLASMG